MNIFKALRYNQVKVTFTKKNGELREMLCTTQEGIIPETFGTSVPRENVVTVWDLEKNAWRSFNEDSVISFEVI